MRRAVALAQFEQRALREDEIRAARHAEIGPPVADHDLDGLSVRLGERALAVAGEHLALAARMREGNAPVFTAGGFEVIGAEAQVGMPGILQHALDDEIEAIGNDGHADAAALAFLHERGEALIDLDLGNLVEHGGGRGAQQGDLPRHALARADRAGLPLALDVAPALESETLENQVRGIARHDGAIEVDEHMTIHTRK